MKMKKEYINPNIEVIKMKMNQHLLEASNRTIVNETATKTGDYYDEARFFDFGEDDEY